MFVQYNKKQNKNLKVQQLKKDKNMIKRDKSTHSA
jgi:hypothetical protein